MDKKEVTALEDLEYAPPVGKVKKGDTVSLDAKLADWEIAAGRVKEKTTRATNAAQ